jgi:transposase-like protein
MVFQHNLITISQMTEEQARAEFERIRWPNGKVDCPHCGVVGEAVRMLGATARPGLWRCRACRRTFSVTVKTVAHRTHLPLRSWLLVFFILSSSKKSCSALQIKRQLGIPSYKTAWHLVHRVRHAMRGDPILSKLGTNEGAVLEADETYVGGKPRYSIKGKRGRGTRKIPIAALVERGGNVHATAIPGIDGKKLSHFIMGHGSTTASLHTDELSWYKSIGRKFADHKTTKHSARQYSRRDVGPDGKVITVHSNTAESFFGLAKRMHMGSQHKWGRQNVHRYVGEVEFRWNHRKESDWERTEAAIRGAAGRRLTYCLSSGSAWQ